MNNFLRIRKRLLIQCTLLSLAVFTIIPDTFEIPAHATVSEADRHVKIKIIKPDDNQPDNRQKAKKHHRFGWLFGKHHAKPKTVNKKNSTQPARVNTPLPDPEGGTGNPKADLAKVMMAVVDPDPGNTTAQKIESGKIRSGKSRQTRPDIQKIVQVANYIQLYNRRLPSQKKQKFANAIVHFSRSYNIDHRLLASLIATESSFREAVVSSSGAIGMGQLKPSTAEWLGVKNPYDPVENIAGTARFLSWLVTRYQGRLEYALSAYYQGPGHVDRNGITPVCIPYLSKINSALTPLM
ncbi:MAG: lytic transglycosylase domain-containing protein [Cyanobacteria bacterium P01_H01_bin.74]